MKRISLLYVLFVFIYTPNLWAVIDLVVREEVKVYQNPTMRSKVISTLTRGDKVVISPMLYGNWRKVLVTYQGKRQGGFVLIKDISLSIIEDREAKGTNLFRKNHSFGFNLNLIFQLQANSNFDVVGFDNATIGSRTGLDFYLGLDYQRPVSSWGLLQFSLKKRSTKLQGNAELIPGGGSDMVEIDKSMISIGSFLKYYKDESSFFWKGAGLEIAKVNSIDVNLSNGAPLKYKDEEMIYIIGNIGMGWDIKWNDKYYITTEARGNVNFNGQPMIFSLEAIVSLSRIF